MNVKNTIKLQTYLELFEKSLQSIDKQESKIEHEWKNLMNEADKESEQINALSDVIQQVIFTNKLNNNLEEQQVLLQLLSRSEENTSELQSRGHLVLRYMLDKNKQSLHTYTT